jgi:hypothetical protein
MKNRNGFFVSAQLPEEVVLEVTMEGRDFGGGWVAILHLLVNGEQKFLLAVKNFPTPLSAMLFGHAQIKLGKWTDDQGGTIEPVSMVVMVEDGLIAIQKPIRAYHVPVDE